MLENLKEEVVLIGQRMVNCGLVSYSAGNVSGRDRDSGLVAITPSGIPYERLRPEDTVVLDLEGHVVEGKNRPSSEKFLHLMAYKTKPDIGGVVHSHSPWASAFAVLEKSIPAILAEMAFAVKAPMIPVAPYARPGSMEVAEKTVAALGEGRAVLLANHGAMAIGTSPDDAFGVACNVEDIAKIFHLALMAGQPIILSDDEIYSIMAI